MLYSFLGVTFVLDTTKVADFAQHVTSATFMMYRKISMFQPPTPPHPLIPPLLRNERSYWQYIHISKPHDFPKQNPTWFRQMGPHCIKAPCKLLFRSEVVIAATKGISNHTFTCVFQLDSATEPADSCSTTIDVLCKSKCMFSHTQCIRRWVCKAQKSEHQQ